MGMGNFVPKCKINRSSDWTQPISDTTDVCRESVNKYRIKKTVFPLKESMGFFLDANFINKNDLKCLVPDVITWFYSVLRNTDYLAPEI